MCKDYTYLNVTQFPITYGVGGYVQEQRKIDRLKEYYQGTEVLKFVLYYNSFNFMSFQHLSKMGVANRVPLLNLLQPSMSFNITVNKPGPYVIIINYVTPLEDQRSHHITAELISENRRTNGKGALYPCPYTSLCRQVLTTSDGIIAVQQVDGNEIQINLNVRESYF